MTKKLKDDVKVDENGNVCVDDLKDFFLRIVEDDIIQRRITKKEFEGFLSAF